MRSIYYLHLLLVIGWVLSGCVPTSSTTIPTKVITQNYSPKFTPIVVPSETATLTPPATLRHEEVQETIRTLLQESVDCAAPCFWGITPEQTTLGEAKNIFTHFGLEINSTTLEGKDFYGVDYDFADGFSVSVILTVQDEVVENLRINLHPEKQQNEVSRKWLAYSPETLIERYGSPSKVNLFVGRGPNPLYFIDMYFDTVDLIIHYNSYEIYSNRQICPLTDQMNYVRIWFGKNPMYPPSYDSEVIPLEDATSLMIEEFSDLMIGDSKKACFNFDEKKFP